VNLDLLSLANQGGVGETRIVFLFGEIALQESVEKLVVFACANTLG
jgi:hypothetical protein